MPLRNVKPEGLNAEAKSKKVGEVRALEARIAALEQAVFGESDKDALVEQAADLGIAAPSQLKRWSEKKLREAINGFDG